VNGAWVGILKEPIVVLEKIRLYKRNGILPVFMSCSFHYERNIIYIYTDEGRLYRPIYYIQDGKVSAFRTKEICQKVLGDFSWESMVTGFIKKDDFNYKNNKIYDIESFEPKITEKDLEENKSVVDYIDVAEEEYLLISNKETPFQEKYTNTEIHPSLIFGVMGNQIIYPENNPYPRNTFSCAHGKQAVSVFHSNYLMRIDKSALVLNYGHIPLIKSKYLDIINKEEQPYGNNVICAIMSYNGYNVEDAILINEGAIQRGLFNTTYYTSYETHEEKVNVGNSKINTRFTSIQDKPVIRTKPEFFYDELDEDGLIKENTILNDKIVLISLSDSFWKHLASRVY
jgi:DNA-directed RNA polymerase beta subunit